MKEHQGGLSKKRIAALSIMVIVAAFMLRAPITLLPPALKQIQADLGLNEVLAGLTTTLPVLCFGVFAFTTPYFARGLGNRAAMSLALVLITLGAGLRVLGGAPGLLGATILIGAGIALGNVLCPVFIRRLNEAKKIAKITGIYAAMLSISAAFGSLTTGPALDAGFSWRQIVLVWTIPFALIALAWMLITPGWNAGPEGHKTRSQQRTIAKNPLSEQRPKIKNPGVSRVLRSRRAWMITLMLGFQSLSFYTLSTWVPAQLIDQGYSPSIGSAALTAFNLLGLITSFIVPILINTRWAKIVWGTEIGIYIGGLLILGLGGPATWIGILCVGFMQGGIFAVGLLFISETRDPALVGPMSAMGQGVGYILAAIGPTMMGAFYQFTGSWIAANCLVACGIAVAGVMGFTLLRTRDKA